ncbi:MAG: hypothetical protein H7330_04075 [Hymenobacteraceae bacterium]|nr:hypothetical protein [Hymenobacteraceae bacterium]
MKNTRYLLVALLLCGACSKKDADNPQSASASIVGKWAYQKTEMYTRQGDGSYALVKTYPLAASLTWTETYATDGTWSDVTVGVSGSGAPFTGTKTGHYTYVAPVIRTQDAQFSSVQYDTVLSLTATTLTTASHYKTTTAPFVFPERRSIWVRQ